jgi:glycerol-3-phosphate dehydrogenase
MPVSPADLVAAPEDAREQLAGRYGHLAHDVLAMGPVEPIVAGRPDLLAEVTYAARREQARTVGDVLLRRTRLGLTAARLLLGGDAVDRVAAVMGAELGWDEARRAREVSAFREEALAEGILPAP